MKGFCHLVYLSILGLSLGQNFDAMSTGGEVMWTEGFNMDDMGSNSNTPFVVMTSHEEAGRESSQSQKSQTTHVTQMTQASQGTQTPMPVVGAGGALAAEAGHEGESWPAHVKYEGQHYVAETKKFSVSCTLTQFDQLKWTHNGKPVVSGEGGYSTKEMPGPQGYVMSSLSVENAHMYHAGEYKCTPFSPRSHTVYVLSAGHGVDDKDKSDASGNESVQMVFVGYPLKLTCNFTNEEGTAVTLDWYKGADEIKENDNVKIFQTNSTLVILNPDKDAVGNYTCQTQPGVSGDDIIFKVIQVIYLEFRKMEKSLNVVEKESITLDCPADGIPPPSILWTKDQKPISDLMINDSRITLGQNSNGMINGTLTINNAQWSDRGNYTCIVTSLLQSYEKWTFLRVKDMYAALWPFIGIVIEVVVLGIIIIIFEKRRAKAEFDESDTDQGNDQKNTADHFKDARRRK